MKAARVFFTIVRRVLQAFQSVYDRIAEWNRQRIERRIEEKKRKIRLAQEAERRRRAELEKRRKEIANATKPLNKQWPSRQGVDATDAVTYGIGSQYVYCYTFPTRLRIAELEQSTECNIKVGMASNHPISRIREQVSASKTAMSESAVVLLVFQTDDCADLERWMHSHLERTPDALGTEWFVTNTARLVQLFRQYVASRKSVVRNTDDALDLAEFDFT